MPDGGKGSYCPQHSLKNNNNKTDSNEILNQSGWPAKSLKIELLALSTESLESKFSHH